MLGLIRRPQHLGVSDVAGSKALNPSAQIVHPAPFDEMARVIALLIDLGPAEAREDLLGGLDGGRVLMLARWGKYGCR